MSKKVMFSGVMMLLLLASCGVEKDIVPLQDSSINTSSINTSTETLEIEQNKSGDAMMDSDHNNNMDMMKDDSMEKDDEIMMKEENVMMKQEEALQGDLMETKELTGVYASYDDSLIGNTEDTVLFFHASWCPSCSAADKGISAGLIPAELTILKTDFDTTTDLRKKYGVVAQHTFVQVDADGNEIKKWVGGTSVQDIVERIN